MELNTIIIILFVTAFDSVLFYLFRKKLVQLKKTQENHHDFLLKVKHDIPVLHQRVSELEEQIIPPEENRLN